MKLMKLLKQLFCVIGYPLLHLAKTSLETGKFANALKTSIILHISKVKNQNLPSAFRPISLLPVVDKYESILKIINCYIMWDSLVTKVIIPVKKQ